MVHTVYRCSLPILTLCLALLSAAVVSHGQTQAFSDDEASCRDGLFSPAYQLTGVLLAEAGACHRARMLGQIPEATDCSDPSNALRPRRIARLEKHLRNRSVERCDNVGTPTAMGYPSVCPQPCDTVSISDFSGVAECSICLARNGALRMALDSIGTPPVSGPSDELDCQNSISDALDFGTRRRMREQRVCQKIQDKGRTSSGVSDATDCESSDLLGKIAKAEVRARELIAECGAGVVANLDSCNQSSIAEVQVCVENAIHRSVREIYDFIYPSRLHPTPLQAFVTSDLFDGSDIAGIGGANNKCQTAAVAAGLTGTFRAWMSTHSGGVTTSSPVTTFIHNGRPYERIDGVAIANSFTDLSDGTLLAALNVDELGATIDIGDQGVWTGTNADGTPYNMSSVSADENCNQWSGGSSTGRTGLAYATDATWTSNDTIACNSLNRMYCFEQAL